MNSKPSISVIVAVYNGAKTLQRCIDSVSNQTYPRKELIIIDGGSTDGTVNILQHNNDEIAYWKSEPDNGIYHAFNKALDHVKGDWIYFLGSDDYLWKSDVLEEMIPHLIEAESQGIQVVYGQIGVVTEEDEVLWYVGESWEYTRQRAIIHAIGWFQHQATMQHRNLFKLHGKFDESFQIAGDYELLLRELKSADAYFIEGLIVAGMQYGGINSIHEVQKIKEYVRARHKHALRTTKSQMLLNYLNIIINKFLKHTMGVKVLRYASIVKRRLIGYLYLRKI